MLPTSTPIIIPPTQIVSAMGYCDRCQQYHGLQHGNTIQHCRDLIEHFEQKRTIAFDPAEADNPALSTEYLFGPARGKMFGVLECRKADGSITVVHAFSGQYNGIWQVNGWAPPLFDLETFHQTNDSTERQIKELGRMMEKEEKGSVKWRQLKRQRKEMSRELMRKLHSLYQLHVEKNTLSLRQAYIKNNGIPTGTGDCCGPKLLNYAAKNNLKPLGIAEFYWGLSNKSGSKQHGKYYPSCREKCQPILGAMLCNTGNSYG